MIQRKTYTIEEAKLSIANYCVYQDRCHKEVREKLKSMGMIPIAIDELVDYLIQENFLNEERFAKSFARGKFKIKQWGKDRIIRELKAREISAYCIKKGLDEIDPIAYTEVFNQIAQKKAESLDHYPIPIRKKKLFDYLKYRGWESSLIFDKIEEIFSKS